MKVLCLLYVVFLVMQLAVFTQSVEEGSLPKLDVMVLWGYADNTDIFDNVIEYPAGFSDLKLIKVKSNTKVITGKHFILAVINPEGAQRRSTRQSTKA